MVSLVVENFQTKRLVYGGSIPNADTSRNRPRAGGIEGNDESDRRGNGKNPTDIRSHDVPLAFLAYQGPFIHHPGLRPFDWSRESGEHAADRFDRWPPADV